MLANLFRPNRRSSSTLDLDGDGTNLSEVSVVRVETLASKVSTTVVDLTAAPSLIGATWCHRFAAYELSMAFVETGR